MKALTVIVVLSNVFGNLALSLGMKATPAVDIPMILVGVVLLVLWMLSRMTLMSWADLSYILPVTAIGYVLSAIAGKLFLAEQVSIVRWAGTLFIFAGIAMVGRTSAKTT